MFNWKKQTVHNAIIQLGDTDDSGKGRHFKSRFMKDGLVKVEKFGNVLIKKENLDKFIDTMVGVPVIINHKDITEDNADDERVGVVNSVWYNNEDGWFWCDGVIWDKTAQNLITDKGWSVSCSYDVKLANDEGGSENNIKYDIEFLDAVFTHLALVNNPRYERANIVFNSKTVIENYNKYHDKEGKFCCKENTISSLIEDIEPVNISSDEIPIFKAKQWDKLSEYVKGIFQENRDVEIKDNGRQILLSNGAAKRTYSKQNPQDKSHNAVYTKIKDIVERAKYFDFIDADKEHPNVQGQELYYSKMNIDGNPYRVKIVVDVPLPKYLEKGATYNYAGHRVSKIEIAPARNTLSVENQHRRTETDATLIIPIFDEKITLNNETVTNFNNEDNNMEINNGWITKYDDDGNPYHVNIEGYNEESDKQEDKKDNKTDKKVSYQDIIDKYDKKNGTDKNDKGESWYDRASENEIKTDIKAIESVIDKYEKEKNKIEDTLKTDALPRSQYRNEMQEKLSSIKDTLKVHKEDLEYLQAHLEKKQSKQDDKKVSDTKILAGGVKESKDEHGRTIFSKKDSNKKVKIHKNGDYYLASFGQELKDSDGYTEFQVFPSASGKSFKTEDGARKWALKKLNVDNSKERTMEIIDKLKALIFSVENEKEQTMVENEKVDKRKLIDEVAGIMKSAGCDDEDIRTAIGKMEKIGYDKSEADTADNKKEEKVDNKCKVKNEDEEDDKEVKEVKEEVKEDVENCGKKGKVDNSKTDYFSKMQEIYNSVSSHVKDESAYVSRADREKAAEEYFAR